MKRILSAVLLAFILISSFMPSTAFATTYVVDKTITWGDETTEHLQVDTDYNIYLNGVRRNLVGIDIHEDTPSGSDVYETAELNYYDEIMTYLESIDVRVVHIQIKPWGTLSTTYTALFDLAYEHHMLVYCLITCRWFMPVDLATANFEIDTGYYVDDFVEEACNLLNTYDNILAISADNELDLMHTEYYGSENYTVGAATAYIHLVADEIKAHSPGVPVTTKLVGSPDYGGFREQCRNAFWPYVDFLSFDTYANTLTYYGQIAAYLRTWQDDNTTYPDTQNMWFSETNAGVYPSEALNYSHDYIDAVTDDGVNVVLLWTSYYPSSTTNGFFNSDGSPKASLISLATELGRIQYPAGDAPETPVVVDPPTDMSVISIRVYQDMVESGDAVVVFHWNIPYADNTTYPDTPASSSIMFQLVSTDNTTVLSTSHPYVFYPFDTNGYGQGMSAFYFAAADNYTWSAAYNVKIIQSPIYFTDAETYTKIISTSDYSTASTQTASREAMKDYFLDVSDLLYHEYEVPLTTSTDVGIVLSTYGESYYRGAIPGIQSICPPLFYIQDYALTETTNTYDQTLQNQYSIRLQGSEIKRGSDRLAAYFGVTGYFVLGLFMFIGCIGSGIYTHKQGWGLEPGLLGASLICIAGAVLMGNLAFTIIMVCTLLATIMIMFTLIGRRA